VCALITWRAILARAYIPGRINNARQVEGRVEIEGNAWCSMLRVFGIRLTSPLKTIRVKEDAKSGLL
jgi:hypothetical protein